MTRFSTIRTLALSLTVLGLAAPAVADEVVANNEGLTARIVGDEACSDVLRIIVEASDSGAFSGEREDLTVLLKAVRTRLRFDCPKAEDVLIEGVVDDDKVYRGAFSKGTDWTLVDLSTPVSSNDDEEDNAESALLESEDQLESEDLLASDDLLESEDLPESEEIAEPKDPVAKAAYDVLVTHCARCHQDGLLEKRTKPASHFGNILLLHEIAADTRFVLPGNPDASELIKRVADPIRADMPYDVKNAELTGETTKYPTPTADELIALRDWVSSLKKTVTAECGQAERMDNADMVQIISDDLGNLPDHKVKTTRYITLTHLKNACVPEKKMEVYRQATIKLLNSLSLNSDVLKLHTVDKTRTIIRFDLNDLKWSKSDWEKVLKLYPYAVKPDVSLFSHLQTESGTALPYIRGDWLAFAASRPPLYYDLLKLPKTFEELQKQLGLDVAENLKNFLAQRAGFQNSGVSQNNRLIERHTISNGVFWTSYDFAGNKDKQNLFKNPLGPKGEDGFEADGGETVFSLPNGFHAYYLNTADGKRIDKGPTEIVLDESRKDAAVTNGISCMGCHDQGIRYNKDEVREHVLEARTHPKSTREAVKALYPEADEMKRLLDADQADWAKAMKRAGIDPLLKLNDVEMINALSDHYERQHLTLAHAAAEFGLDEETFVSALDRAGGEAFALKRRLEQGLVPRDHFEEMYSKMMSKVSDDEMIGDDEIDRTDVAADEQAASPTAEVRQNSGAFHLTLFSDKSTYKIKDAPEVTVKSEVACYLTLINVDTKGTATVLFPNKFQQENFIDANKSLKIPGPKAGFEFKLHDKGTEVIVAKCTEDKDAKVGVEHEYSKNAFTTLGNYRAFVTRQITVVATSDKTEDKTDDKTDEKTSLVGSTAITFEVTK